MKWSFKNRNWLKIKADPNLGILNYEFLDHAGEKFVI
jgi:hypothetical protein